MMKSKIHRATVTDAHLHYVGSITLDERLMELADIAEFEQVHVLDIDNGNRLTTYAISGRSGEVCLNGAAAHLVSPGDRIIILSYGECDDAELAGFEPRVVHVDSENRPVPAEVAARIAAGEASPGPVRFREVDAGSDQFDRTEA
jgi:aspartate 1-decarboxylase